MLKRQDIDSAVELAKYVKYVLNMEIEDDMKSLERERLVCSAIKQYCNSKKVMDNIFRNEVLDAIYAEACEGAFLHHDDLKTKHDCYRYHIEKISNNLIVLKYMVDNDNNAEAELALYNLELSLVGLTEEDVAIA